VSAGLALSLAETGARGATARALAGVVGTTGLSRAELERGGDALVAGATGRRDVELGIATAIWVDSGARLAPSFAKSANAWRATAATLRLTSPDALATINRWADSATHHRIKGILEQPLGDGVTMFLANAVYFKGRWLHPFEREATRPRDFTLAGGGRIRVPTMELTDFVGYRRERNFQIARLPYRMGKTAMYLILPDSGVSPAALEHGFATSGWPAAPTDADARRVHVALPKVHVEMTTDLQRPIAARGGGIAFDCDRADFGDLAIDRRNGAPLPLCIGSAVQRVYLDVDEAGTEAAAVTGLEVTVTSVPPRPVELIVDRPFLFVLRDEQSGADLFVGHIARP
jgi:Serine protease inhibitor